MDKPLRPLWPSPQTKAKQGCIHAMPSHPCLIKKMFHHFCWTPHTGTVECGLWLSIDCSTPMKPQNGVQEKCKLSGFIGMRSHCKFTGFAGSRADVSGCSSYLTPVLGIPESRICLVAFQEAPILLIWTPVLSFHPTILLLWRIYPTNFTIISPRSKLVSKSTQLTLLSWESTHVTFLSWAPGRCLQANLANQDATCQ